MNSTERDMSVIRDIPAERESPAASLIQQAVEAERLACARIVMNGGDGMDRMEIAIAYGPNAAIAEAILARGEANDRPPA